MVRNYVRIGPVAIRVSSRGLAPWGYPYICLGRSVSLLNRTNTGDLVLLTVRPRNSVTWTFQLWVVSPPCPPHGFRLKHNSGSQTYWWLPFRRRLLVLRQMASGVSQNPHT